MRAIIYSALFVAGVGAGGGTMAAMQEPGRSVEVQTYRLRVAVQRIEKSSVGLAPAEAQGTIISKGTTYGPVHRIIDGKRSLLPDASGYDHLVADTGENWEARYGAGRVVVNSWKWITCFDEALPSSLLPAPVEDLE